MEWRSDIEGKEADMDVADGGEVVLRLCLLVGDFARHVLLYSILP